MKKIIVGVCIPEDGYWCDCDLALVEITPELSATVLDAAEFVKGTKNGETHLHKGIREVSF